MQERRVITNKMDSKPLQPLVLKSIYSISRDGTAGIFFSC